MRTGLVLKYVGAVLLFDSAFMLTAVLIALFNGMDSGFTPLMISFILTAILGVFPLIFVRGREAINAKESYCIVTGAWLLSCVVGMFPYLLWGGEFNLVNAWFESVSGFTTTGASILTDVESLPRSLLFWRSSTHWIGGIGVVMFALAVLPSLGKTRMSLYSVELSPMAKNNFRYQARKAIRILLSVYVGMTALETVLLRIAGMNWFDAVNHSFSTIATGGFSTKNLSIAAYHNIWIEIVITIFMFLSGLHLGLIFATIIGSRNNIFRSEISRYYALCAFGGGAVIALNLWLTGTYTSFLQSLRYGIFQSVSYITTTGFGTAEANLWPPLAMAVLIFLSVQCACAGSSTGGIKSDRMLLAFKVLKAKIRQQQHPNAVLRVKLNGVAQDEQVLNFAMFYIVVYAIFIILGTIIATGCGTDFVTSFTAVISSIGNVGPGFGTIGTMSGFAPLPDTVKMLSTALMLLGRMEIFGLLQLFSIRWWI